MSKKILIIDDDVSILEALKICLEDCGYTVRVMEKVEDHNNIVNGFAPDLILLDLRISGTDGKHIAGHLKKDSKTKNIPIIMISAHPLAKKASLEAGVNNFVAKPFDLDYMLSLIKTYIN